MYGRTIDVLVDHEQMDRGKYTFHFDAYDFNLSSGVYYFSLVSGNHKIEKKMLLLK